mmetsp:Transcript_113824/g.226527  ORF Transcript_113824/g.226527 Transcript_113824/m.226527 type:complete len:211 (+) Transcript_113824:702-1334(+)
MSLLVSMIPVIAVMACSTLSSVSISLLSASSRTRFTAIRCSTEVNSFRCFPISPCAVLSRVWNLMSSVLTSTDASFPFASICLAVTNFRTSMSMVLASFSQALVLSLASRISSAESSMSFPSSAKMVAASFIFSTRPSASATRASAARIKAARFRLVTPLLSSTRRLVAASICFWNSVNFWVASAAGPAENRFTSNNFICTNIRAMEEAV